MTYRPFLLVVLAAAPLWSTVHAQAWSYPAFQPPQLTTREFNFAVADAGRGGTSLIFQWREIAAPRSQLSFDFGVGAPDRNEGDNVAFAFGQYAYQMHRASADIPLDFLFTAGAGIAIGNGTMLRAPVGLSLGRRFELEGNLALTPWVHPRLSVDVCSCGGDETELSVPFDVGANLELSPRLAIRVVALFGGNGHFNSSDGIGISVAWTPPGLAR